MAGRIAVQSALDDSDICSLEPDSPASTSFAAFTREVTRVLDPPPQPLLDRLSVTDTQGNQVVDDKTLAAAVATCSQLKVQWRTPNRVVAVDGSTSLALGTNQRRLLYFSLVQKAFDACTPDDLFIVWTTTARVLSHTEMAAWIKAASPDGGTSPSCVATILRNFHGHVDFFTDGDVTPDEVAKADAALHESAVQRGDMGHVFEGGISIWVVDTNTDAKLSVASTFGRFSDMELHHYRRDDTFDPVVKVTRDQVQELEHLDIIATLAEYQTKIAGLLRAAMARFMGTHGSRKVRDSAIALKNRLVVEASRALSADVPADLQAALQTGNTVKACDLARQLVDDFR